MFSAFPDGWPGVGLLLLRAVVGAAAVAQAVLMTNSGSPTPLTWLLAFLAVATGGLLTIGFLTPAAGVTVGAGFMLLAVAGWPEPASGSLIDSRGALFVLADAVAIVLIGPGAFSLDARLFGRREIVIPHQPHAADF